MSAELHNTEISVEEAARMLAAKHCEDDEGTEAVYWFPDEGVVRLLETTTNVNASGEIFVVGYNAKPQRGLPFPSELILIHPLDLKKIESGALTLPASWSSIQSAQKIF